MQPRLQGGQLFNQKAEDITRQIRNPVFVRICKQGYQPVNVSHPFRQGGFVLRPFASPARELSEIVDFFPVS